MEQQRKITWNLGNEQGTDPSWEGAGRGRRADQLTRYISMVQREF